MAYRKRERAIVETAKALMGSVNISEKMKTQKSRI